MDLYNLFNGIGLTLVYIYNLSQLKKKENLLGQWSCAVIARSQKKLFSSVTFWAVMEILVITAAQYSLSGFMNTVFGNLVGTGANYYGLLFFAPLFMLVTCWLLKVDARKQIDLVTPAYPLGLVSVKIACYFAGCCRGIEWEYGFYNRASGLLEFPVQLVESGVALMLFFVMRSLRGKLPTGTMFPVYLMIYSAIRFFTEFLRCEPGVLGFLKTYQLLCIAGVLVGAAEYWLVTRYNARIREKE